MIIFLYFCTLHFLNKNSKDWCAQQEEQTSSQTEQTDMEDAIEKQNGTTQDEQHLAPQAVDTTSEISQNVNEEVPTETAPEVAEPVAETASTAETALEELTPEENQAEQSADASATEAASTKEQPFEEPVVNYATMSREEMVAAMKELLSNDVTLIKLRVGNLRQAFNEATAAVQKADFEAFLADGGEKDTYQQAEDAVGEEFRKLYADYRKRRQQHQEAVEAQKQESLAKKQALLEQLRQLIESEEPLKQVHDSFNAIQEQWKQTGDVPRSEANTLWQNYHFLVEQFFNKVKIDKELRQLDMKKNLEQKLELCEQAEKLIVSNSPTKAFRELQALRTKWKTIGPVALELNDEIWARFNNAADQIVARNNEFYEQRRAEQEKNLLAKQALITELEQLVAEKPTSSKQWAEMTEKVEELMTTWRTIGYATTDQNDAVWKQFKGRIDQFYAARKEYYETIRSAHEANYNKKVALCVQAEAIALRDDWKKATEELLKLQQEWREIGTVERKHADKLWTRFRAANDEFFNRKSEHYQSVHGNEQENLATKEAILAELKAYEFGDDKEENLRVIKEFQRRWIEAGFVPMSEKDRLQTEFRNTINHYFEQLKISAREAAENAYREHLRLNVTDEKQASGERQALLTKLEKLRGDLSVWENNMGFFAESKQADLLKQELERKMQSARQQIALLETKLKMLETSMKNEGDKQV